MAPQGKVFLLSFVMDGSGCDTVPGPVPFSIANLSQARQSRFIYIEQFNNMAIQSAL